MYELNDKYEHDTVWRMHNTFGGWFFGKVNGGQSNDKTADIC